MQDKKDIGIAVSNSKRLNDCYYQLTEEFTARLPIEHECKKWARKIGPAAAAEDSDWLHRGNSANMAESNLIGAILRGDLPLWVRLSDGEHPIDRYAIKEVNHRSIVAGSYQPLNDTNSNLAGRPLWVKNADWCSFYDKILARRYGESAKYADTQVVPNAIIVMPMPKDWGSAGCEELPTWLNMYQLVAWVQYRNLSIVAKCDTSNGLAAQHMYGTEKTTGSIADLERELQEGHMPAEGLKRGESFAPIRAVEWTRIRLAPLDLARQHPYIHIQVKREDALALFPPVGANRADAVSNSTGNGSNGLGHQSFELDEAKVDWRELWQGPLYFRATYDKGKFGPGHTLESINQYGKEGATGEGRNKPIYTVRLDPDDGAIVIEWLIGLSGRSPPFQTVRYYYGGLERGLYQRLRDDPQVRDQHLCHLPADHRARAVGAFACAITIREWAEREFFQAVNAGLCEIWARVGSKVAPFQRIPPDIFDAYEIQEWGYGKPGGAWAKMEGAEPLYSIRVSPTDSYLAQQTAKRSQSRMQYHEGVQWCRDWIASGKGNGMDSAWAVFSKLSEAGGCARDTFFRPAWKEAKTIAEK